MSMQPQIPRTSINVTFNTVTGTIEQFLFELHAVHSQACSCDDQLLHLFLLDLIADTHKVVARMKHINAILHEQRDDRGEA